jgi:hypothetical protein
MFKFENMGSSVIYAPFDEVGNSLHMQPILKMTTEHRG